MSFRSYGNFSDLHDIDVGDFPCVLCSYIDHVELKKLLNKTIDKLPTSNISLTKEITEAMRMSEERTIQ